MILALAGNPNCGKTTLFNALTGANQRVGNFPGVTVEQKTGEVRRRKNCSVADLPGIYSLRPYTQEEIVSRDFLLHGRPDGIISMADAMSLERGLYLTLQLIELGIPTVLALNRMDEIRAAGGSVDVQRLSRDLGIPVVPISALRGDGVSELMDQAAAAVRDAVTPKVRDFCPPDSPVHRCIHAVSHLIADHAERAGYPPRFCASRLMEGDEETARLLELTPNERETLERCLIQMEEEADLDRNAALASVRYAFLESVAAASVVKPQESAEHRRSMKLDRILTGKYTAVPVFCAVLFLVFRLTFGPFGGFLSDLVSLGVDALTALTGRALTAYGINPVVRSLVLDGIFVGVGSVLSFLPLILVLFFFLSLLEDTGYLARAAFVMDRALRKIGLSGRSFVPLLLGFGCTVPAVMASRTVSSDRDRKMTILLTPFMSCSAKIPIYAVFAAAFFPDSAALVMIGLYLTGIVLAILLALCLKSTVFRGNPVPFVMELPDYRLPSLKSTALLLWEKAKDFLTRAFSVIFVSSLLIWFLETFDARLNPASDAADSLLALLAGKLAPVFQPLGFGNWRAAAALLSGFTAKESVVSTLAVLLGCGVSDPGGALGSIFTELSAVSFLVFTLLYTPCAAAIAAVRREFGSGKAAFGVVLMQCGIAWICAFLVYRVGGMLL